MPQKVTNPKSAKAEEIRKKSFEVPKSRIPKIDVSNRVNLLEKRGFPEKYSPFLTSRKIRKGRVPSNLSLFNQVVGQHG